MTFDTVYKAFYDYVKAVTGLTVIEAFSNEAQPNPPFISIKFPSAQSQSQPMKAYTSVEGEDDGLETARTEFQGTLQMWATSGVNATTGASLGFPSDILRPVVSNMGLATWENHFSSKGISLLEFVGPLDIPRASNDTEYIPEATLTFTFAIADEVTGAIGTITSSVINGILHTELQDIPITINSGATP